MQIVYKTLLVACYLCYSFALSAHEGTIKGIVKNGTTQTELMGATILLQETDKAVSQSTTTDALGIFEFSNLPKGNYEIQISYIGFAPKNVPNIAVTDNETTNLKINLSPDQIDLPEIEILSQKDRNLNSLSALDIQLRPINNAQEILRLMPGLVIAQHAGGGKAEQIFLRGFDIDHGTDINLSVDGMPVNMVSHAHGQGYSDLHFIIPEIIGNVDFKPGPYAADVGNFSTAGYAGFQTATALDQSMVKLEAGQFDSYRLMGAFDLLGDNMKQKNQRAYLASEYTFTNGYFNSPQNFTRLNLFGKYNGMIGENRSLTVSFSTFESKWDASGQIPVRAIESGLIDRFGAIDDTEGGQTSRTNVNAILMQNLGNRTFVKNQVYFIKYDFELYSNFTFFANNPINGDQIRQKENRSIVGYNSSVTKETSLLGRQLQTEVGIGLRYDDVNDNELSRTKNRRETLEQVALGDIDEINAGVYASADWQLTPELLINAGLRYDQFHFNYVDKLAETFQRQAASKGTFSPKLNAYYNFSKTTQLYFHAGQSFHSNDTRVVVAQNGNMILPNATGIETGVLLKPLRNMFVNLSAWQLDLEQEFVYVGDEGIVEPSGATRRRGVDLAVRYQILDWLYADVNYNYTLPRATEEAEGENYIPLAPTTTSIGGLSVQTSKGFNASLRYRYLDDRAANEDFSVTADGYFLLDALITYRKSNYELGLSAQNLLNTEWKEAQFDTESRLPGELEPISEIHFTPGTPFFLKGSLTYFF